MAQNVTIAGVTFADVPSVEIAKSGGGSALFVDPSPTTATAADVASGKSFFHAAGTLTSGTASGGGGGAVQLGALRPDAERINVWNDDYYIVADRGVTIPSYSTSAQTLLSSQRLLSGYAASPSECKYLVTCRMLSIPVYNTAAVGKGRIEWLAAEDVYEGRYHPANTIPTLDGSRSHASNYVNVQNYNASASIYYMNDTTLNLITSNSYGVCFSMSNPSFSTGGSVSISTPNIRITGNTSYFTQTYFEALTDARIQYVIEFWRVPITSGTPNGFGLLNMLYHTIDCVRNGGTLT